MMQDLWCYFSNWFLNAQPWYPSSAWAIIGDVAYGLLMIAGVFALYKFVELLSLPFQIFEAVYGPIASSVDKKPRKPGIISKFFKLLFLPITWPLKQLNNWYTSI
jgi:hypothetical protein